MTPTQAQKDWAEYLRENVGGDASVVMYEDDRGVSRIPIFSSKTPDGLFGATIGLMDLVQGTMPDRKFRTEIMMRCRGGDARMLNILSSVAFYAINDQWNIAPRTVYEDMVSMFLGETGLPHILFTAPQDWARWGNVKLCDRLIHPLLAVPVSTAEADIALHRSLDDLENGWREHGVDIYDWGRNA